MTRRWNMKMNKKLVLIAMALLCASSVFARKPKVKRVDAEEVIDLDGYWNDTDIRTVCETLVNDCIDSPRVAKFEKKNGRAPCVVIGKIKNDSSERIDTSIVAKKMQTAIINSGVLEFVADSNERVELREEKADQAEHVEYGTAKEIDAETAADFLMTGSVKTQVQSADKYTVRSYFVYVTLTDIQSNKIIWQGENSDIKKYIKNQKVKL